MCVHVFLQWCSFVCICTVYMCVCVYVCAHMCICMCTFKFVCLMHVWDRERQLWCQLLNNQLSHSQELRGDNERERDACKQTFTLPFSHKLLQSVRNVYTCVCHILQWLIHKSIAEMYRAATYIDGYLDEKRSQTECILTDPPSCVLWIWLLKFVKTTQKHIYVCNKKCFLESSHQFIGRETNLDCFLYMQNPIFLVILKIRIQSWLQGYNFS